MCSRFFEKALARRQSVPLVHLLISLNKLYILCQCFSCRFRQVNIHCSIGSISRSTPSRNHNAADQGIAMNNCQSFFRKLLIFFSGNRSGQIGHPMPIGCARAREISEKRPIFGARKFCLVKRKKHKMYKFSVEYVKQLKVAVNSKYNDEHQRS